MSEPVVQDMKRAVVALGYEVPAEVHKEVRDRWNAVVEYLERLRAEAETAREQRAAVERVRALHQGAHVCTGGGWWTNDQTYTGKVASKGDCPTLRALEGERTEGA